MPYDGIEDLSINPIKISSRIGIATNDVSKAQLLIQELMDSFKGHGINKYIKFTRRL